jgi:threonine synthase
MKVEHEASGYVWCPHSATAAEAYARLTDQARAERPWIAAATAHPFKFREAIEPVIGLPIEAPPALAAILGRRAAKREIPPELEALAEALEGESVAAV